MNAHYTPSESSSSGGGPIRHSYQARSKKDRPDSYGMLNVQYKPSVTAELEKQRSASYAAYISEAPQAISENQVRFTFRFHCNRCKTPLQPNTTPGEHVKEQHLHTAFYKCSKPKCDTRSKTWKVMEDHYAFVHPSFTSPPIALITGNTQEAREFRRLLNDITIECFVGQPGKASQSQKVTIRDDQFLVSMDIQCLLCNEVLQGVNNSSDSHVLHVLEHIRPTLGLWSIKDDWMSTVPGEWLTEKINTTLVNCFDPYQEDANRQEETANLIVEKE